MSDVPSKVCCSCSQNLPLDQFTKNKAKRDGHNSQCKPCLKEYSAKWRAENAEYLKKAKSDYYQQNQERELAKMATYRDANRDKINAWHKEYREANPELFKTKKSKYYEKNKDRLKPQYKAYRDAHPEYSRMSCHKRKGRLRNAPGTYSRKQFLEKVAYHGSRCYLCKKSLTVKELHMEHRIPISRGGSNWPANLAPACAPCNLAKGNKTEKEYLTIVRQDHAIVFPNCPSESVVARLVSS